MVEGADDVAALGDGLDFRRVQGFQNVSDAAGELAELLVQEGLVLGAQSARRLDEKLGACVAVEGLGARPTDAGDVFQDVPPRIERASALDGMDVRPFSEGQ